MENDATRSKAYRLVTAALGVLFAAIALAIVVESDRSLGPLLVSAVIGVLGAEAVVSAWRNKPSLLSRIGPLP